MTLFESRLLRLLQSGGGVVNLRDLLQSYYQTYNQWTDYNEYRRLVIRLEKRGFIHIHIQKRGFIHTELLVRAA